MARQHPLVAVEPEALPELRAATVEAHTAIQDLRSAERDARDAVDEVRRAIEDAEQWSKTKRAEIDELLGGHARAAMAELGAELERGRDESLERIHKTMDDYWRIMLGEDRQTRESGEPSIGEMIHRRIIRPLDEVRGRVTDLERRTIAGGGT